MAPEKIQPENYQEKVDKRAFFRSLRKGADVANPTDANWVQAEDEQLLKEEIIGEIVTDVQESVNGAKRATEACLGNALRHEKNALKASKKAEDSAQDAKEEVEYYEDKVRSGVNAVEYSADQAEKAAERAEGAEKRIKEIVNRLEKAPANTSSKPQEVQPNAQSETKTRKEPTHEEVQLAAYLDWANDGKPAGNDGKNYYYNAQNRLRKLMNAPAEVKKEEKPQDKKNESKKESADKYTNGTVFNAWITRELTDQELNERDDKDPVIRMMKDAREAKKAKKVMPAGKFESQTDEDKLDFSRNDPIVRADKDRAAEAKRKTAPEPAAAATENSPKSKTREELIKEYQDLEKRAQEIQEELKKGEQEEKQEAEPSQKPEPENKEKSLQELIDETVNKALQKQKEEFEKTLNTKLKEQQIAFENKLKDETKKAQDKGKEDGENAVLKEFNSKRSLKERIKLFFKRNNDPKTAKEKADQMKTDEYRRRVAAFAIGAGVTLATWAVMQATGNFLPFIPIHLKEIIVNALGKITIIP